MNLLRVLRTACGSTRVRLMMIVVVMSGAPPSCPAHPERAPTRTTKPRERSHGEARQRNKQREKMRRDGGEDRVGRPAGRRTHQSVSEVSSMTSW